jgi:hypothetical protein
MKKLMLISVALALLVPLTALAQDATKPSDDQAKQANYPKASTQANQDKSANQAKIVTGCIQKGEQPNTFSLTGDDGKTWDLRSSTVNLADHVGHQVTVSGSVTREAKAQEKKEGQVEKAAGKEELGELQVTDLKMVSQSCAK